MVEVDVDMLEGHLWVQTMQGAVAINQGVLQWDWKVSMNPADQ